MYKKRKAVSLWALSETAKNLFSQGQWEVELKAFQPDTGLNH
ncbi:Uncharacterized protein dnl_63200 [Desulfonema limicola]|uniref:Uncharacterized protein n=1 Tax=Desulfonema limicola TaxID=45656 RepID=A0A975BED3_9BACT|nr:Uncharacterized protein dnl_63200 [Desulfonema limicola]